MVNILFGVALILSTISIPLILYWKAEAIVEILK